MKKTPILHNCTLTTPKYQIVRVLSVLILVCTVGIGYSQSYTLDWSEYRLNQIGCGLPATSESSSSYDDLNQDLLLFGNTKISITNGPEENIYCASGKIRNKNGGESYVFSATLDAESKTDCSWMIIEFSEPVNHVSFELLDIDYALLSNWQDELTITPEWSSIENNANLIIDTTKSMITGTANCNSESQDCNSRVTFDEPLLRIRIDYCYGSGTTDNFPDRQIYNIGNIDFEHYNPQPSVSKFENCPGQESRINIEDIIIEDQEILEIAFANADGIIENTIEYDQIGIYNLEIPKKYTTCGEYQVLVSVLNDSMSLAQQGEMISSLESKNPRSFMLNMKIIDNESPTFLSDQQDIMYLTCEHEIPNRYYRPARDNCLDPSLIDQDVWEEHLEYNDECLEYNIRRFWSITDLCGNTTIDYIDYIYKNDENLKGFIDEEDIIVACNVFSPNGDGINDYFAIYLGNLNIAKSEFYIFDRSGNLIYQEMNFKGERVETKLGGDLRDKSWVAGIYVWMLKITDIYGKTRIISREVTILL